MMTTSRKQGDSDATEAFEQAVQEAASAHYVLVLYIAGMSRRSIDAIANLTAVCDRYLPGRYEFEIVDVIQQPARASAANLIGMPTLIKEFPAPMRKMLGNLSDEQNVLVGLGLTKR